MAQNVVVLGLLDGERGIPLRQQRLFHQGLGVEIFQIFGSMRDLVLISLVSRRCNKVRQ
jgi:hypothetical protein